MFQAQKNKKTLFIAICGILLFAGFLSCKKDSIKNEIQLDELNYSKKPNLLVSAHRGGKGLNGFPENSLETIKHLYKKGISIFEIDISSSSDDVPMLYHDKRLGRTSLGKGFFEKKTAKQLKDYLLIDDFGQTTEYFIPTFEEALEWLDKKKAIFMVDVKKGTPFERVIYEIQKMGVEDKCVLISYNLADAQEILEQEPKLKVSVPVRNQKELDKVLESEIPKEKVLAFTGTRTSKKDLYEQIHENDMLCILGTMGNLDKRAERKGNQIYAEFAELGVDIFATDRPLEVQEFINGQK